MRLNATANKPRMVLRARLPISLICHHNSRRGVVCWMRFNYVKIEGWMIRNMQHNDRVLSVVKSVVMPAQTLGVTTIAECVEDARTAEILRDMEVDWGQG